MKTQKRIATSERLLPGFPKIVMYKRTAGMCTSNKALPHALSLKLVEVNSGLNSEAARMRNQSQTVAITAKAVAIKNTQVRAVIPFFVNSHPKVLIKLCHGTRCVVAKHLPPKPDQI